MYRYRVIAPPGDGGPIDPRGATRRHHLFHQVPDLPEALTVGRERTYLEFFFMNGADQAGTFSDADIAEYVRSYSQPGAMRAGFSYYRAMSRDVDDNRATLANGFKLPMPTLGLGGGVRADAASSWSSHCEGSRTTPSAERSPTAVDFIPEEKPQELAETIARVPEKVRKIGLRFCEKRRIISLRAARTPAVVSGVPCSLPSRDWRPDRSAPAGSCFANRSPRFAYRSHRRASPTQHDSA